MDTARLAYMASDGQDGRHQVNWGRMQAIGKAVAACILCVLLSAPLAAQTANATVALLDDDPAPLLGGTLAGTLDRFGAPSSVYAVRGAEAWQDDVAFGYVAGFTFFIFGDRVWQLRLAAPYAGSIYGLFLGDHSEKALSTLGQPYERTADSLVYRLPYRGYPVKLRLVFASDALVDVYLYRADF